MKFLGEEQGVGVEGGAGGDAARQPICRELEVWLPLQLLQYSCLENPMDGGAW